MIEIQKIDIFKAPIGILIHSANCFHTMGAGIARDIKLKYPRAYQSDCFTEKGSRAKLGQFSLAAPADDQPFWILNCYTQHRYGRDKKYVEVDKFLTCMENVLAWIKKMELDNLILGIPYLISCCNAGGDWNKEIFPAIKYVFEQEKLKVLICDNTKNS